ncbi:periplasmic binding protein-like I [Chytriomyces sp. MP71]|nr:periplasmic binding protein-like I [Chytriomyces sp. MP71]
MGPNIFGRIYAPLTIFIDESPKMEATSAVTTLASKLHSNITLAFINWYCLVPDLKYDGSRVTNWQDAFNSSRISTYDQSFTVYLYDIMGAAAVSVVNHRTDIFPNTTVNVERFSDCGQYWPTVEQDFIGHTIGYSAAETAQDIVFKNTDVIGVFGNQYSSYAKVTGEIFSDYDIPYCTAISGAPTLADKKLYPFLFRLMEGSIDKIVNLALQSWNVTRMAIIYEYDDLLSSATAFKIQQAMKSSGIDVVSMVKLSSFVDQNMIDYAAIELTVSQARYIYLSGQSDFSSKVFFSLAIEGLVGPDYVWFGQNTPGYIGTDISKLPKLDKINSRDPWNVKRLSSWLEGFLYTSPSQSSVDTPLAHEFYKQFLELSQFSPDNITYLGLQLENLWGVFSMFDCVLMMLTGFDEFLKNNPQYSPQQLSSRELSSNFNFSYFRSIQYNGLISSPLHLDENGDIEQ